MFFYENKEVKLRKSETYIIKVLKHVQRGKTTKIKNAPKGK